MSVTEDADLPGCQWMVLYCSDDDSHVLVDESKVVCEDSVSHGDKVKFACPGVKDLLEGVVMALSRDKKKMIKEQDRLNKSSKPKRERSFDPERPRRAALNAKQNICRTKISSSERSLPEGDSKSSRAKEGTPDRTKKPLSQLLDGGSSSESEDDDLCVKNNLVDESGPKLSDDDSNPAASQHSYENQSSPQAIYDEAIGDQDDHYSTQTIYSAASSESSSSDLDLTPAEQELYRKLSRKKRRLECKDLMELANSMKKPKTTGLPEAISNKRKETDKVVSFKRNNEANTNPAVNTHCQEERMKTKMKDVKRTVHEEKKDEEKSDQLKKDNKSVEIKNAGKSNMDDRDNKEKGDKGIKDHKNAEKKVDDKKHEENGNGKKNGDIPKSVKMKDNERSDGNIKVNISDPFKVEFLGSFYKNSEDTPRVVQFQSQDVYITEKDLKDVKRKCLTSTATARFLLTSLYTPEALEACSVSGIARMSKTTKEISQRPALHQAGVEAILEFVAGRASKKGWPAPTDSAIKQSLNNKLGEMRSEKRARLERIAQLKDKGQEKE